MTYEQAIAVRKRKINNQPVGRDELAQANRVIAHQRSLGAVFGNEGAFALPAPPRPAPVAPAARAALPLGCISVTEWKRTLRSSESYQPRRP